MTVYKTIVERKVRSIFDQINQGNYEAMVEGLASEFDYLFLGDNPLGGRRRKPETVAEWWQRIFRLLPGAQFDVHEVIVQGLPHNTRIAVRSTISDGDYCNDLMQFMTLRFGKVTRVITLEDTAKLATHLAALDPNEFPDAVAAPLVD